MIIDRELARQVVRPRPQKSHKGTFGRTLLIGGNYPYGGAIIMAALACVNSGAGLTMVATHKDNITALHAHLPEAMAFAMNETERLTEQIRAAGIILIGPGLAEDSLAQETLDLVLANVSSEQTLIIDGSALTLLAEKEIINWPTDKVILTPHQKEWERVSGLVISDQTAEASQEALDHFPKETVLVAKSDATKVITRDRVGELTVGGPYQATGGMGDTLAGSIAGFVAQFGSSYEVVAAAVYVHSAIAEELSAHAYVVLPTAISAELPRWMKALSES